MTDRSSSIQVGKFVLSTDRDHRGRFRGSQAMSADFRGWHYHVEHPDLSQDKIFTYLSQILKNMGAEQTTGASYIGVVEATPKRVECWRLGDATTVLDLWQNGQSACRGQQARRVRQEHSN